MTRSSPLRAFRWRLTARVRPGSARGLSEALPSLHQRRFPGPELPSAWPCGPLVLGSIPIERFRSEPRSGTIHIEVLGRAAGGTYNHSVAAA